MSIPRPDALKDKPFWTDQAFHGTNRVAAASILKDGFALPAEAETQERFGPGAYFWENSVEAAHGWAERVRRFPKDQVVAIRAEIDCKRLLDLMISAHFKPYTIVANLIARNRRIGVQDVKPAAVLSVMRTAGWIDGARIMAPHGEHFSRRTRDGELYGPSDVIICIYDTTNIVVRETIAA